MDIWSDIKSFITEDGTFGLKLCKVNGVEFVDFRELHKQGAVLNPSKNGLCFHVSFAEPFEEALRGLLDDSQGRIVGNITLTLEEDGIAFKKFTKTCKASFEHCDFILEHLKYLFEE